MDLSIDFETRSHANLQKEGVYRYAAHPSTEIICMAWAVGDMSPNVWWPGDPIPSAFTHHQGNFRAWNATFERLIWHHVLRPLIAMPLPALDRWYDTAAEAATLALPRALGKCAEVLGLDAQKDEEGRRLMLKYSRPRRLKSGTVWWSDPADLKRIGEYCATDVLVERAVAGVLPRMVEEERALWLLDQRVNDRGIRLDMALVKAAQAAVEVEREEADRRIQQITRTDNMSVTRVQALTAWVQSRYPDLKDLTKASVREALGNGPPDDVREVLELRQDAGRSSLAKWFVADQVVGAHDRARGLLRYHAASTGRWGGQLLQPQNFPRPSVPDVELMIPGVLAGRSPGMEALVSLLRSMVIPADGKVFMSGDYTQIELRILAWLSGGTWQDKPYERMASKIYGIPLEEIEKGGPEYAIGKNAELGCGYNMGWSRFQDYVYLATGETPDEETARKAVAAYRDSHPNVVDFWAKAEAAALAAVTNPGGMHRVGRIVYTHRGNYLFAVLPSGRSLAYALPRIVTRTTPWGAEQPALQYQGIDSRTGRRVWGEIETYGGHLVENIVQAVARDVMASAMLRVEAAGYPVVLTVHDEILAEVDPQERTLDRFHELMVQRPKWAETAPIAAECWEGTRWRK